MYLRNKEQFNVGKTVIQSIYTEYILKRCGMNKKYYILVNLGQFKDKTP